MAVPTTLLAYQTGRLQQLTAQSTAAQNRLRDVQLTLLPAIRKTSHDLAAQSVTLGGQMTALQQAILQAATAADAQALIVKLEKASIDLRQADAKQVEAQRQIGALLAEQTSLSAAINTLPQSVSGAQAEENAATARQKRIQDAAVAVASAPLNTVKAAATTALTAVAAADTRVQADVPAALLARATERRKAAVDALNDAAAGTAKADALANDKLQQATSQAEDALSAYIAQAQSRLAIAEAAVTLVTDPSNAPLTAEEKARLADTDLVKAGTDASAAEKKRDDAQTVLNTKQAALDDAILQARNTDIDVDLTTVAAVTGATKDRDDALNDLNAADAAFTSDMRNDLHRWEAALPDANWNLVDQLEEAKATLNELSTLDATKLGPAIDAAETAWVAALYAGDKKERTGQWIDAQVQARASAQDFENNINRHRRLTALRGDQ